MDAKRFDLLVRILAAAPSRRELLGLALGGAAALLGLPGVEGKKKKGKKKKCGACGPCRSCANGACKPKPNGTACGGACVECRNGACVR